MTNGTVKLQLQGREMSARWNRRSVIGALSMLAAPVPLRQSQTEAGLSTAAGSSAQDRAKAVDIIKELRRIVTPDGTEKVEAIPIGGIDQFVSVRSRSRSLPVLLIVHGGPGWVAMPTSWWFARGWEEYFTVIQWDQRGAGKTYTINDPELIAPTMTFERMECDLDEIALWARKTFNQKRIFILGHSWGSLLGLLFAKRRPEWLHAYIGVGQGIDALESERRGWRWAHEAARSAGHIGAMQALDSVAPYAISSAPTYEQVLVQRRWLGHFGGAVYRRPNASFESAAFALSPEYTNEDLRHVWQANQFSASHLFESVLKTDLTHVRDLSVPLLLFLGRHDRNVSATVAAEWYEEVSAPAKHLVWFEQSAHEILVEEPGKVFASLINLALPFSYKSGE